MNSREYVRAVRLLQRPGALLTLTHTHKRNLTSGRMFTIEPGGYRVTHDVGKRITVRPDCIIVDGGLFKGFPQSWRLTGRRL